MPRVLILLFISLFYAIMMRSQNLTPDPWGFPPDRPDFDAATLMATGLPLVEVTTVNGEEPRCDFVTHPEGAMGLSITNATTVQGRMVIRDKVHEVLYDSGPYEESYSGATFRLRGNTSAWWGHRSYKVTLQQNADLIQLSSSNYLPSHEEKHWLLLGTGPWLDIMVGTKVSELIGMEWTPRWQWVNLMINGSYQGIYAIVEQVRRNPQSRINVDRFGGYIVECDPYWWNEKMYVRTSLMHKNFTFKYPDDNDVTATQLTYMQKVLDVMEASIEDGTYAEQIDVPSFARWLLAHDILGTYDSGGSNMFMAKQDESTESKFRMPCLWDFDSILRCEGMWSRVHDVFFYFAQLFHSPDDTFTRTYYDLFKQESGRVFREIRLFLADFRSSSLYDALERSHALDRQRYQYDDGTTDSEVTKIMTWFANREVWLEDAVNAIVSTSVRAPLVGHNLDMPLYYDLGGRRLQSCLRHQVAVSRQGVGIVARKPQLKLLPR